MSINKTVQFMYMHKESNSEEKRQTIVTKKKALPILKQFQAAILRSEREEESQQTAIAKFKKQLTKTKKSLTKVFRKLSQDQQTEVRMWIDGWQQCNAKWKEEGLKQSDHLEENQRRLNKKFKVFNICEERDKAQGEVEEDQKMEKIPDSRNERRKKNQIDQIFSCPACDRSYGSGSAFKRHCLDVHNISNAMIRCQTKTIQGIKRGFCTFKFPNNIIEKMCFDYQNERILRKNSILEACMRKKQIKVMDVVGIEGQPDQSAEDFAFCRQ